MLQGSGPIALRVNTFKGLQTLPLLVARSQGFFAAHGLDISISYASGSAAQIAGLARGEYDLIQTAPDNVIFAESAPGAFGLEAAAGIRMVLGGSLGPLSIYARPAGTAPADLRGATLGVDNPDSGFALVLRDLLARDDVLLGRDYAFTVAGGTSARLDALTQGAVAATLLYAPYDTLAEAAGSRRLADTTDHYPAYASLATAGLRGWMAAHAEVLTHYLAAMLGALRWIHDRANAARVHTLLREEPALGLDAATAASSYAAFVAPQTGFGVDARLDEAGLNQVIALRRAYGTQTAALGGPMDYCEPGWYERAREMVLTFPGGECEHL